MIKWPENIVLYYNIIFYDHLIICLVYMCSILTPHWLSVSCQINVIAGIFAQVGQV